MERFRPEPNCCFNLFSLLISCKWIAALDLVITSAIAGILINYATVNCCWIPGTICFVALTFLIALFLYGLFKENDNLMIPLIVAKVLLSLAVSVLLIIAWMLFLLSLFSIIDYESPIDRLTTCQFFLVLSLYLTATFFVCLRILFLYSKGYKYIKKENDFKHAGGCVITSNCVRSTHRPTSL